MTTEEQLKLVFNNNFVLYYRSHVAHVNVVGRTFVSDHKLLGKVYEELQEQIDVIAELLRTMDEFMPDYLHQVMTDSGIDDNPTSGTADELITQVRDGLEELCDSYIQLNDIAVQEKHDQIANYAQDRILALKKHLWMFNSVLK